MKITIKESPIHGKGAFSAVLIKKGEVFHKIPLNKIFHKAKSKCAFIGNNLWVSDNKILNWVNHSCDANTKLNIKNEPKLVALKDIKEGDEITCNYNETEKGGKKVECNCKTIKCKGYFLRIE